MRSKKLVTAVIALAIALQAAPADAATFVPGDEARMVSMINGTRAKHGVGTLKVLQGLTEVARDHSAEMVRQNNLFHNPTLAADISAAGISVRWRGENVVLASNIDAAYNSFLGSSKHLENIVRPNYNAVGVGVAKAPSGVIYATQVFAEVKGMTAPVSPPTVAPAPPPPPPPPATPVVTPKPATPNPTAPPAPKPVTIAIEGGIVVPQPPFGEATSLTAS